MSSHFFGDLARKGAGILLAGRSVDGEVMILMGKRAPVLDPVG
jgi:hypothetical protein